jgi:hypothetical protein
MDNLEDDFEDEDIDTPDQPDAARESDAPPQADLQR